MSPVSVTAQASGRAVQRTCLARIGGCAISRAGCWSSERLFAGRARCHSTDVLVQPITASIQRVRVPPWESSDCPGSHIRRARGATLGRESPEVQVPGGPTPRGRGRLVQGREQSLGPQHQANRCSVVTVAHQEPPFGGAQRQLWEFGSAEPVRTGRRPASAGKKSDICTRGAPRRRGGGTKERIDVSKWGRSAAQPRPDRMAKTRRITAEREVAERAADWRLRPYER
jgi:hypothetical protein